MIFAREVVIKKEMIPDRRTAIRIKIKRGKDISLMSVPIAAADPVLVLETR